MRRDVIVSLVSVAISCSNSRKVLVFLILCLCTLLASGGVEKHIETGGQLLVNQGFANGLEGWQVSGAKSATVEVDSAAVQIHLHEQGAVVALSQQVDPAALGDTVVLKGSVKAVGIAEGTKGWEKGRVVLVQYVEGKPIYSAPHVLIALDGTNNWADYSLLIPILANVSEVVVSLQLLHCTGELHVKNLMLYQVRVNPVYRVVQWVVFGSWGLFLACVFVPSVIANYGIRTWAAFVVLVILLIIIGTTFPASLKNGVKAEIIDHAKIYTNQIAEYSGPGVAALIAELKTYEWLRVDITKVGHFLLFGFLGCFLCFGQGSRSVLPIFVDIGMLACGTELMQLFINGRSALLGDVLIDLAGAGFAVVVLLLLIHLRK
jgi:hypothetical protein